MRTTTAPFRILTVCTGNICRSPMAERLLQAGMDSLAPGEFEITSAGTGALVGSGIEPHVAGFVNIFGGDSSGFTSRQLTAEILQGQDLVLALTRGHRSKVVELAPGLLRRTFTLRELARLLPLVDADPDAPAAERWQAAMSRALRLRSAHPAGPEEDDVVDPYRRSDAVYQQMVRELTPAVDELLAWERRYR
ncbi:low molecular weight phosphatase family protein [Arthrobacter sp. zg-Y826]|uniref:arsenate reductase/protein-tyrosine-phosphatase family protein n=1 Tax=Arthrobacter jinronghuae TaxID=2964609 RepID=UPI002103D555|nr:low molecular weight phosphatase family protein [Arthrobacter jinronghuae]MCQ1957277.1 low molecular weight phosphatase family protein [Arthrobacter jinronghuae]